MSDNDNTFAEDIARELGGAPMPTLWQPRPAILLHPNIPKPMHGLAPRVVLGTAWWDQTRRAAYASTGNHCAACVVAGHEARSKAGLEGHELYDIDYPRGRMVYRETVPLCYFCHAFVHDGRTETRYRRGLIPLKLYEDIMKHGQRVLRAARLKNPKPYAGPIAEWSAWRMVVDGAEYPPLFANYAEWERYFTAGKTGEV